MSKQKRYHLRMVPLLSVWQFYDGLLLMGTHTLDAIQIDSGSSP